MASPRVCSQCGQPMRALRVGVYLPPVKAAIFDAVKAAGPLGITSREIVAQTETRARPAGFRAHMWQLENWYLDETDWRIVSDGRGANARWYLRRRPRQKVA